MATSVVPNVGLRDADKKQSGAARNEDQVQHGMLIGAALFDGTPTEGVAFVLDLRDQKRAEQLARERERQYHESQVELAHANRVATTGHLSASIVHELSQPLSGAITNAHVASRSLAKEAPGIANAQSAIARIIRDGSRATEVLSRIRNLVRKAPPKTDRLSLNELVVETVALTQGEAVKNAVSLQMRLDETLHSVEGDRVQLQQVILNLIMNALDAIREAEPERREVLIQTRNTDAGVHISVQDSGPGIPPEKIEGIFEPFTPPRQTAWGWDSRFAAPSSRCTAAGSGRALALGTKVLTFNLPCPGGAYEDGLYARC